MDLILCQSVNEQISKREIRSPYDKSKHHTLHGSAELL